MGRTANRALRAPMERMVELGVDEVTQRVRLTGRSWPEAKKDLIRSKLLAALEHPRTATELRELLILTIQHLT